MASAEDRGTMGNEGASRLGMRSEIERLAVQLWKSKLLIAGLMLVSTSVGVAIAFLQTPVYQASALVMPKEGQKQSGIGGALAGLGGVSGMLATQFGVGNANLDRLEVIVKGWELADSVITKHNLLPEIFNEAWDTEKSQWKSPVKSEQPSMRDGIDMMRSSIIKVGCDPLKNIMTLTANARTAEMAVRLVEVYLMELNGKIRQDIIDESKSNQAFLQAQMRATLDPLILTKIQNMLGFEMEREMLVTHKSIDILEGPLIPTIRTKPKRKRIIGISILLGLAAGCLVVYARERPA